LYTAIFSSTKPEAKEFKKWVTSEVLPTIRKTGLFATIPNKINGLVEQRGSELYVSTLKIAEFFQKDHNKVIKNFEDAIIEIQNIHINLFEVNKRIQEMSPKKETSLEISSSLINKKDFINAQMIRFEYVDSMNRIQFAYKVNRVLFNYVVLNYTGENANLYRYVFIQQFEAMDQYIKVQLTKQELYKDQNKQSVYIIKNELTGLIKIGIAKDPMDRMNVLSNQSGCPLQMVCFTDKCKNAYEIEHNLHRVLTKNRAKGEWFNVAEDVVVSILQEQSFDFGSGLTIS
jgi:phage regulator Rha-like protein